MIVVCDSSPLVALSIVNRLDLLDSLFTDVLVPVSVFKELTFDNKPEAQRIAHWAEGKITAASNRQLVHSFNMLLDLGESEAMALYIERNADFLLIDERKGRKIASYNKINIVGSLGIILMAKQKGFLSTIKPLLNRLQ